MFSNLKNAKKLLQEATSRALLYLYGVEVSAESIIVNTTSPSHRGDYTIILFPLIKLKIKSPTELGDDIGKWLVKNEPDLICSSETIQGFLNVELSMDYWLKFMNNMWSLGPNYYKLLPKNTARTIMVEYSSPNTNKPLHLGHLRNTFLGWSISEILKSAGHSVIKANLVNDRGIHICKSMVAYERYHKDETPQTVGKKGDHFVGDCYVEFSNELKKQVYSHINEVPKHGIAPEKIKLEAEKKTEILQAAEQMLRQWEDNDPAVIALWEKMNGWVLDGFEQTYTMIGCDFNKYYYESDTYILGKSIINDGIKKKVFTTKEDGSVWVDLTEYGLDPKILLRSDGTSVYITQDIGTAQLKYDDFGLTDSLYVIGNEQDYHMKVLKATLDKLGVPWAQGIHHISYGMVELPSGRMKSREGTVVDADELVSELIQIASTILKEKGLKNEGRSKRSKRNLEQTIAIGALKYYLLNVEPSKKIVFNPDESVSFEGRTGVYIQYNHARMSKIRRDAASKGLNISELTTFPKLLVVSEKTILTQLHNFQETLESAAYAYSPNIIANYVYELAQSYSSFYNELPIIKETNIEVQNFRLLLTELTRRTIQECLRLLGIGSPERM